METVSQTNGISQLLKPATNQMAAAKVGIMGFAGSGKTYTATLIAVGLHKHIKSTKPIAFLDTETGSDFVLGKFKKEGIELLVAKTRAFRDLLTITREIHTKADIFIIDSISHIWAEIQKAYLDKINENKSKKITRLEFHHWQPIKAQWREFTDLYLNSPTHIILSGRAGYEYDYDVNEEDGKKELIKTGTKMKAETEMAYEPSLLIEMEKIQTHPEVQSRSTRKRGGSGGARAVSNRAFVLKDRSDLLDGQYIENPTFESFLPHFQFLNIGGTHHAIDTTRQSTDMFDSEGRSDWQQEKIRKQKWAEEIEGLLVAHIPGRSADDQARKKKLIKDVFDTYSWTAVEEMPSERLKAGFERLKKELEPESHEGRLGDEGLHSNGPNGHDTQAF